MSQCPCEDETTPCPKETHKPKKKCEPQGIHAYVPPNTVVTVPQFSQPPVKQLRNPYSGICPPCSILRNPSDPTRCGPYPRYEANRQSIQKCRDPSSCVPQSSDQLTIYNTFCPITSKGKTSPSLHVTTMTNYAFEGPPQFILGSTPAIPPFPPIIIPQPLIWYEEYLPESHPWDLRNSVNRSFNTGWLDITHFRIATPGRYRLDVHVLFVGVGSIIAFIFDFLPALLKMAVLYIQYDNTILDLDLPMVVGEAPSISYDRVLNIDDPKTFRSWIVTALPAIVVPTMTLMKMSETSGTSIESLNITKAPYYNNP